MPRRNPNISSQNAAPMHAEHWQRQSAGFRPIHSSIDDRCSSAVLLVVLVQDILVRILVDDISPLARGCEALADVPR